MSAGRLSIRSTWFDEPMASRRMPASTLRNGFRRRGKCSRLQRPAQEAQAMDYRVELDAFHGPLDLLLYLVKKNEVDIFDIPIAKIAEQFQEYLRILHVADVERAGDFLVMAATLM